MANSINRQDRENGGKGLVSNTHFPNHKDWTQPHVSPQVYEVRLSRISALCSIAQKLFFQEERCVKVSGPTTVFGDLHGNLADVLLYERLFWPRLPSASNFVFLGDYVDRGLQSLEVFLYMLALKVMEPAKFTILRGNHETRQMQTQFSFQKECLAKFGRKIGSQVWQMLNQVMDCMPFCAVINDSIFCAHGGIPTSVSCIKDLNLIPTPLVDPELEGPAAWEIMWNDPVDQTEVEETGVSLKSKGFMPNIKRGTAFLFSQVAVDNFLKENNLSHVIRAHEMRKSGMSFHFNGKVATVFSCSFYSGQTNIAAVIKVEENNIIPIQIQTMRRDD
jgi:diadenosine tetraphosphatase ApaH/serine/threonine PP2A family protein phosphatase